ncbi:putative beta-lysine N-acetyltransferase [Halalkalibacterium halodurans]|uniref:putative beta-lysine N-acetyltransferase n=1 Tax=Halalkalibacterium halodurans TaxID=86665 RepID=UPI002AAA065B|nr:putative beta-lysine N-acetyltransferase [Halalkalibacterium halodurans]MDY7222808.1 putative beta-lysine N-acetyltransferase [Halalkalibacterium halodurans]MDY7242029.1 putative beta-lysine N-acetyltransferase [Halalkalibacterium halodurans]
MDIPWLVERDDRNERIVLSIKTNAKEALENAYRKKSRVTGKMIAYVHESCAHFFCEEGWLQEGAVSTYFHNGQANVFSFFLKEDRQNSDHERLHREVLSYVQKIERTLELSSHAVQRLNEADTDSLAQLYRHVFERYPTDVFSAQYLQQTMKEGAKFVGVKEGTDIICAASAVPNGFGGWEITDCATKKEARGNGYLSSVLCELEQWLWEEGEENVYSITRSHSFGMNVTIKKRGFSYEGTMVNNCIIGTGFEDMNIWTKRLTATNIC